MFQKAIVSKYLQTQNAEKLLEKWSLFQAHFQNPLIQENIRNSKEEQYQGEFLIDLFVNVLGYTKNPTPNFNLTTEYKNVKDSKKADGAIIINDKVTAIIELKGTNTTNLSKIEDQAFGYKNNQDNCKYVITSNFEKLRFYVDNAIENTEFNLFELSEDQFNLMYLILAFENIKNDIPKKLKDESLNQEDIITKKLYKDYSVFKRELFQNLTQLNPEYDPLILFQKSQKLLDRLLFLFFGEDRGLLPPNFIRKIIGDWNKLKDLDAYFPLYDRYKQNFEYLNSGKNPEVYAYNGGLFKEDEILDHIKIDDKILYEHTYKLSQYDFASEVDVNILGHIFENSLNEIDEIKAELEGQEIDKSKSKRKKDGVFYTPKYITKYIVENTIGKLCEEKKTEFEIVEEEYSTDKKRQQKTLKNLLNKLDDYRTWLLQITIVDPASGSGAFLNEALNFLINEHQYIDELEAKLRNVPIIFSYHSESILEHNLFGVDLNEESVEIAKLSLWLRTAERNRKLNSLNNNIKCGNSLIDDVEIAGDKAFNWQTEFPQVFAKGGFDVVIGNPPYVNINTMPQIHEYLKNNYTKIHTGYNDLMYYFLYKGFDLLLPTGVFGVITSNYFIQNDYADKLRSYLNSKVEKIVNFQKYLVFEDANVHSTIVLGSKNPKNSFVDFYYYQSTKKLKNIEIKIDYKHSKIDRKKLSDKWIIADDFNKKIIEKLKIDSTFLGDIFDVAKGSESGKNEIFTVDAITIKEFNIEKSVLKKCIKNSNIFKYSISFDDLFLIYADNDFSAELYPNAYSYLKFHKDLLLDRRGPKTNEYEWWRLHRPSIKSLFEAKEKLIVPYRANTNRFAYDDCQLFNNGGDVRILVAKVGINQNIKFVLSLINSKLLDWYYGFIGKSKGDSREYFNKPLQDLPIKNASSESQKPFIEKADQMLSLTKTLLEISAKFQRTCERKFENLNINKKLQDWYNLSYADFIKELSKQKIKLTLSEEAEWADYFDQEKSKALETQSKIESTDKEIDQMVYELYGLSEEEIGIVEN